MSAGDGGSSRRFDDPPFHLGFSVLPSHIVAQFKSGVGSADAVDGEPELVTAAELPPVSLIAQRRGVSVAKPPGACTLAQLIASLGAIAGRIGGH